MLILLDSPTQIAAAYNTLQEYEVEVATKINRTKSTANFTNPHVNHTHTCDMVISKIFRFLAGLKQNY